VKHSHRMALRAPAAGVAAAALTLATVPPAQAAGETELLVVDGVVRVVTFESALYPPDSVVVDAGGTYVPVPAALASGLGDRQPVDLTLSAPAGTTPQEALAVVGGLATGTVTVADVEPTASAPETPPVATDGEHTVLVLPVYWTPSPLVSQELGTWAQSGSTAVSNFWTAASGGVLTTTTNLRDPVQITDPGTCDPAVLRNTALAAHGVAAPTDPRTHVVVLSQYRPDCYVSAATIGGPDLWINGSTWQLPWVHGFGHSLGLRNDETLDCPGAGVTITLGSTCLTDRGSSDIMGSGLRDAVDSAVLGAGLAEALGWGTGITADPTQAIEVDLSPGGTRVATSGVRVPLADGTDAYVERRASGVVLTRIVVRNGVPVSQSLTAEQYHTPLRPGAVVVVGDSTHAVAVLTADAAGARVAVTPRGLDTTAPVAPVITSPASGSWLREDVVAPITWTAATDAGSGLAGYRLLRDGRESTASALTADRTTHDAYISSGSHTYEIQAVDRAGNVSSSGSLTVLGGSLPPAPAFHPVFPGFGSAAIYWSVSPTTPQVLDYELTVTPGETVVIPAGTAHHRLEGLAPGEYQVRITARNAVGTSPVATTTFTVAPPTITASVTALGTGGVSPVKVSWSVTGTPGYLVEVALDGHPLRWLPTSASELTLPVAPGQHSVVVTTENQEGERVSSAPAEFVVAGPEVPAFVDVPPGHPFAQHVRWMAQAGITTGYSDGTYRPNGAINRDAMAAFLYRYANAALEGYTPPDTAMFSDVPMDHPFYTEISWLAETGITRGYSDGTFRPSSPVNRDAMAAFLYRFDAADEYYLPPDYSYFDDVPLDHQFFTEIAWMADAGISTGWPDFTYRPGLPIARDAMAAFLYRFDHPLPATVPASAPDAV